MTIGRGENSGRTIAYTNVVRHMRKVGDWNGAPVHFDIPQKDLAAPDADGYVVLLQAVSDDRPGAILAAAQGH